jgi:uroporphyrin-III C-methyltransferase
VLDLIPSHTKRISVGKRAGGNNVPQTEINRMLVRLARPGQKLVRLKGGDPAIFARLGEEIAALRGAGIAYQIVPGITAASAAVAACGIPLTLRGVARRVQFVAAHAKGGEELNLDWPSLADSGATTVFYMARASAARIARELIAHGLSPATPVLLISDVSQGSEMRLRVTLSELPQAAHAFPPQVPLLILMGEVMKAASISAAATLSPVPVLAALGT